MEKDKSRGINHMKDKQKYKKNNTKVQKPVSSKQVAPKRRPNLESNWDRYEEVERDELEYKSSSSTDFGLLAKQPISVGSNFQFKSDKALLEDAPKGDASNLFCLNLDMLSKSMLTVPFYELVNIPKDYFTVEEIQEMDDSATRHISSYREYIKDVVAQKEFARKSRETPPEKTAEISENLDILDEVLTLIQDNSIEEEPDKALKLPSSDESDLDEWINNYLDN